MRFSVNEVEKECVFWVSNTEAETYQQSDEYKKLKDQYNPKKYNVCVFVGGEAPLIPTIKSLLDVN